MERYIVSELAKMNIKLTKEAVIAYKVGIATPPLKKALAICEILGIDFNLLQKFGFECAYSVKREEIKRLQRREQKAIHDELKALGSKLRAEKSRNFEYLVAKSKQKGADKQ